jgi:HJR/Mrr/RecB family endonuclease
MNKSAKEMFKRLDTQNQARQRDDLNELVEKLFPKGLSSHPKGTVARFADELHLPVELLIEQFERSGIRALTPAHRIEKRHKTLLLQYLRKAHAGGIEEPIKSELLYAQDIVDPVRIVLLEEINKELLFLISQNPNLLYQLGPRKFEELIAKLFSDQGYEVSLTPTTRDGGYDLLAKISNGITSIVVLAECKRYQKENKVGVEIVRGLYGVTEAHRANQGLIITSSYFTKDAREEQLRIGNRIGLKDFNNLVEWLKPYGT